MEANYVCTVLYKGMYNVRVFGNISPEEAQAEIRTLEGYVRSGLPDRDQDILVQKNGGSATITTIR